MLSPENRLKDDKDFQRVFKKGRFLHFGPLTLHYLPNNLGRTRAGFIVSRKTAPQACQRNKIKRRFRAIFRLILAKKCQEPSVECDNYDIVIVVRKTVISLGYKELREAIIRLLIKAKIAR